MANNLQYLTWGALFELRAKLNPTEEQLAEPVLFTIQDAWGDEAAYPVRLLTESLHPSDGTHMLYLAAGGEELELAFPDEHEDDDERRPLRKLPLGGLRLGFSEMDEDFEEATTWLARPNPHTPPPAPGPAPLFAQWPLTNLQKAEAIADELLGRHPEAWPHSRTWAREQIMGICLEEFGEPSAPFDENNEDALIAAEEGSSEWLGESWANSDSNEEEE